MALSAYLVFTTTSDPASARKLARAVLRQRLAACVHIAPSGESHYWWKNRLEKAREFTVTFKTTKKTLPSLMRTLKQLHPYETPEILAVCVAGGNPGYLRWLESEIRPR